MQSEQPSTLPLSEKPSTSMAKPSYSKSAAKSSGRWTKEEHQRFVEGIKKFGKNWKQVEDFVGTRNGAQIRSHAQKFFNRLQREFNLKFEDLNLQSDKAKLEETLNKMCETSDYVSSPKEMSETKSSASKLQKDLTPIPEVPYKFDALVRNSMQSNTFSLSGSPKLNHFEYPPALARRNSRKMSEDILHTKNYSLFDVLISKIKTANNTVNSPKLSDLVEISSSTRSSFDATNLKPQSFKPVVKNEFSNTSFRPNPRKMSEDNVLINVKLNQLLRAENNSIAEYELISKKMKAN
jgi:SHAQKYF class myb-like DNA-binding protein